MRTLVRLIAAIQAIGAAAAGFLTVTQPVTWVDRAVLELLALAGVLGAVGVWRGTRSGYRLSLGVQAAQVLRLQTPALTYLVGTGLQLVVGVLDGQLALTTGLGAGALVSTVPAAHSYVGCNLAALASAVILWWASADAPAPAAAQVVPPEA